VNSVVRAPKGKALTHAVVFPLAASTAFVSLEVGCPPADNDTDVAELRQLCWEHSETVVYQLAAGNELLYNAN